MVFENETMKLLVCQSLVLYDCLQTCNYPYVYNICSNVDVFMNALNVGTCFHFIFSIKEKREVKTIFSSSQMRKCEMVTLVPQKRGLYAIRKLPSVRIKQNTYKGNIESSTTDTWAVTWLPCQAMNRTDYKS